MFYTLNDNILLIIYLKVDRHGIKGALAINLNF